MDSAASAGQGAPDHLIDPVADQLAPVFDASTLTPEAFQDAAIVLPAAKLLQTAYTLAPEGGAALEFGVFSGKSLRGLALAFPNQRFTGFDSFEGLPEDWIRSKGDVYKAGHFKLKSLPPMPPNVTLVKGFFDDTLIPWLAENPGPISFLHIDCDLYGGARHVLTETTDRLLDGAVIVFDELADWQESGVYTEWREGEWRALHEWLSETGFRFRIIGRGTTFQAAIQVYRDPPPFTQADSLRLIEALHAAGGTALARQLADCAFDLEHPPAELALLSIGYHALGDAKTALDRIKAARSIAFTPEQAERLSLHKARALFKTGDPEKAQREITKYLRAHPHDAKAATLGGSIAKRLRDYEKARALFSRAYNVTGDPALKADVEDLGRLSAIRPEFRDMKFSGLLIQHILDTHAFTSVLDVGSGSGEQAAILRAHGKQVVELDYGGSIYHQARQADDPDVIIGDFVTTPIDQRFDCVIASHVLEHQLNVHQFLSKAHAVLNEGGVLAISVPPAKHAIVGGHVTLWNAGLLLYNLVLAGFNCRNAWVRRYGYNISVALVRETVHPDGLEYDNGDIDRISPYLPKGFKEGFDGDIRQLG